MKTTMITAINILTMIILPDQAMRIPMKLVMIEDQVTGISMGRAVIKNQAMEISTSPEEIADQVMGTFTILALTQVEIGEMVETEGTEEMVGMEANDVGVN